MKSITAVFFGFCVGFLSACSPDSGRATDAAPADERSGVRFERLTLDDDANGPAFAAIGDLTGDGKLDLVVTKFGRVENNTLPFGEITLYVQGDDLASWTATPVLDHDDGVYWPNDVHLHDIDDDDDLDLLVGTGFLTCPILLEGGASCGGLIWLENRGSDFVKHEIVTPTSELFFHSAVPADVDGDGIDDLVTVGESRLLIDGAIIDRAEAMWFRGQKDGPRFEDQPRVIGDGLGSIPTVLDVDDDGDLDVASAEFFAGHGASFVWYEQTDLPSNQWTRHVIDDGVGPSIHLSFIDDLLGDGRTIAVGSNHVNTQKDPADPWESAIYAYEKPADPKQPWKRTKISEHIVSIVGNPASPQAAPGIFGWGDVDGDDDLDLVVSGDGDPRVFLLEQTSPGLFATVVLDENIPQAGGQKIADLDGDGQAEIVVTGYENNAIYIYSRADDGAYPLGAPSPAASPDAPADIDFEVTYTGAAQGNLFVALFETWPPAGPPDGYEALEGAAFPASLTLSSVAPASYTALVVLDVEPFNPQVRGPEDLQATVTLDAPVSNVVSITLQDGNAPVDPVEPTGDAGSVTIKVAYAGPETGQIVAGIFESLPPTGPPTAFEMATPESFPTAVTLAEVPAGTHQALAFLDLEPLSPTFPGPEDPIAMSEPFDVNGAPVTLDLELALP